MIEVKRRKNESVGTFLYRFNKRIQQSGVLKEVKKRRATARPENRRKRKISAIYRARRESEIKRARKLGYR